MGERGRDTHKEIEYHTPNSTRCSYYRMCSHTTECVLILQNVFIPGIVRMTIEQVASDTNVFSYYRMCSHTTECVLTNT